MRIKNLQKELKKRDINLALFFSLDEKPDINLMYFTGYSGIGILAITKTKSFLLVPDMEYEKALKTKINVIKAEKKKRLFDTLKNKFSRLKLKRIGIDNTKVTISVYKAIKKYLKAKTRDISEICDNIRKIKDDTELKNIRTACLVTDKVYSSILKNFDFKSERELKEFIEREIRLQGCDLAFSPIVASGKNTSIAHYESAGKIKKGFLMLDFGARYNGYCADMTRMIYVGKPSKNELDDYDLVLSTLFVIENSIKKNKKFSTFYIKSLELLGSKSTYFTHALGHGLGLEIHEMPSLYSKDKNIVDDNIVFTIEPGIYFAGKYGIRVEDTMVFKNNQLEILTKSGKELVIIG
ncbi:MAG: Xaa-Pro peptidase family protein [archaeon]